MHKVASAFDLGKFVEEAFANAHTIEGGRPANTWLDLCLPLVWTHFAMDGTYHSHIVRDLKEHHT